MLTTPMTTINQYGSETDDVFIHVSLSQSPSDGFVGLPPPPPPPPAPPVNYVNNDCKILLPHQEIDLVVNRANVTDIQARSIPSMFTMSNNIWTRRSLTNLCIKQAVFDQHFGDSTSLVTGHYRRGSVSASPMGGGGHNVNDDGPLSFVLLDATSKMLYDVPMRHLLQLVKKDYDDDASIDHVIRAIDETHMKSEWLDAVTALNKQFDKRPEDKARVLAHKGSTHGLVLIEQFFVKLVRVPAYEFKLIYLKFREEAPTQLERMSKHINDLLESIQIILNNEQLPGVLHLLCLLYNSITGKTIPGLHFDSLLSVLSTRTLKQNTTIAHVLCHLFEEQYPTLLNIFDNQILLKLKDLSGIKYIPIYIDIRLLHTRYQELNVLLNKFESELIFVPEHIKTTLNDLQTVFIKLFDDENRVKQGEKDLSTYFCIGDLSLEVCLSTLGQFIDKLRLSHMQNLEQRRRSQLLTKQQSLQTPTRSLRSRQNSCRVDTNIFRDHLNVPLTPISARQRAKVNRITRDHYSSSRDIAYDEQQEQTIQNLLTTPVPRKRGHSPATKTVMTKRPFNVLETCTIKKQEDEEEEENGFVIVTRPANEHEDSKMDCSINESAIVPSANALTPCVNQTLFYLSTPIRPLVDFSSDQSIPTNSSIIPIRYENDLPSKIDEDKESKCADTSEKENNSPSTTQNATELSSLPNTTDGSLLTSDEMNRVVPELRLLLPELKKPKETLERQTNTNECVQSTIQTSLTELNSISLQKIETPTKRPPSTKNLRSISTNNTSHRNVQRCAVSRRFPAEKDLEETHIVSAFSFTPSRTYTVNRRMFSTKSKTTDRHVSSAASASSSARPLRAFQMSTFIPIEPPKATRKTPATSHYHSTIQKTPNSRTVLMTVLPSSTFDTNQKNN